MRVLLIKRCSGIVRKDFGRLSFSSEESSKDFWFLGLDFKVLNVLKVCMFFSPFLDHNHPVQISQPSPKSGTLNVFFKIIKVNLNEFCSEKFTINLL